MHDVDDLRGFVDHPAGSAPMQFVALGVAQTHADAVDAVLCQRAHPCARNADEVYRTRIGAIDQWHSESLNQAALKLESA